MCASPDEAGAEKAVECLLRSTSAQGQSGPRASERLFGGDEGRKLTLRRAESPRSALSHASIIL